MSKAEDKEYPCRLTIDLDYAEEILANLKKIVAFWEKKIKEVKDGENKA